jgi:SPP1 gp7 family putative phage head morphogenesis protein
MAKNRYKNHTKAKQAENGPKNAPLIVQELNVMSADRSRKDVGDWRSAHQTAEAIHFPNRCRLYDLYDDILLDGHLTGIIGKRMDAVINKSLYFEKDGKRIEALDDLIESATFTDVIRTILETPLWGISGIEFIPGRNFAWKPIPRKHIKPEKGFIAYEQYGEDGVDYQGVSNIWIMGKPRDLGLLLKCSPYALWKRGGMSDWAQYVEIFGQPVRVIKYDSYDQKTKMELKEVLQESGSSLALMIPKQADFDMKDGKQSNGTGELHVNFKGACDSEMSIIILGNTETTTSSKSSGYAQSKEHSKQQLEITKSDLKYVRNLLNEPEFLAILKSYGFPVDGGRFRFEKEIDLDALITRLSIDEKVHSKVPISDDYWYETYGVPKPDNYEELKAAMAAAQEPATVATNEDDKDDTQPPPKKGKGKLAVRPGRLSHPTRTEGPEVVKKVQGAAMRYIAKIKRFFMAAPLNGGQIMDSLSTTYATRCNRCGGLHLPALATSTDSFMQILEEIALHLFDEKLATGQIHPALYRQTADNLLAALSTGLGGSTFEYEDSRNTLKKYLEYNIHSFSAAKSLSELVVFRDMLTDNDGTRRSFASFRNAVMDSGYLFNKTYLRVEDNNVTASAQMAFQWEQLQKTADFIELSTVGDDRVRPQHAILDGFTAHITDPVWNKLWPPLDWECRCTANSGIEKNAGNMDTRGLAEKAAMPKYFQRNVGKTRAVFDDGHPYYKNSFGNVTEMSAQEVYGMPSPKKLYADIDFVDPLVLPDRDAANAWWKTKAGSLKGSFDVSDHAGNIIRFDGDFRKHLLEGNRDGMHAIIPNCENIVKHPDEVWAVMEQGKLKTNYLKYYSDFPYVVGVNDNTAYAMHTFEDDGTLDLKALGKIRRGVLLHKQ